MGIKKKFQEKLLKTESPESTDESADDDVTIQEEAAFKEKVTGEEEDDLEKKPSTPLESMRNIFQKIVKPEERSFSNFLKFSFWKDKGEEYRAMREQDKQDLQVYEVLSDRARPSIDYYILTILSCVIATLGLIMNSTAIIIGAMIVAPLMTPILAFSLSVIRGDFRLMRISTTSIIKGTLLTVLISAAIAYIVPLPKLSNEIIMRTVPSLFDVMVALASGIVGAYGYANKKISNIIIGIAIAVALMPPLCTIGIGLGELNLKVATGATILFLINLVSMSLAAALVFWVMKIHPVTADQEDINKRTFIQILISIIILVAISIPVSIIMFDTYQVGQAKERAAEQLQKRFPWLAILDMRTVESESGTALHIMITGNTPPLAGKLGEMKAGFLKKNTHIKDMTITFVKAIDPLKPAPAESD